MSGNGSERPRLIPNPADINLLSHFLANSTTTNPSLFPEEKPTDVLVICASELLHQATTLFTHLHHNPQTTKTLVLCGGIGHSTHRIYDAVARHPVYNVIADQITNLPEARVLEVILNTFFGDVMQKLSGVGCRVLVEDQSTNCGANASFTRRVLEGDGIVRPGRMVVVQDPTMTLRTVKSFERVYQDVGVAVPSPEISGWPLVVPEVELGGVESGVGCEGSLRFTNDCQMWSMERFLELIVGEIPRLRDDENGYGPRGKGFIVHVDVPVEVEETWGRVKEYVKGGR